MLVKCKKNTCKIHWLQVGWVYEVVETFDGGSGFFYKLKQIPGQFNTDQFEIVYDTPSAPKKWWLLTKFFAVCIFLGVCLAMLIHIAFFW